MSKTHAINITTIQQRLEIKDYYLENGYTKTLKYFPALTPSAQYCCNYFEYNNNPYRHIDKYICNWFRFPYPLLQLQKYTEKYENLLRSTLTQTQNVHKYKQTYSSQHSLTLGSQYSLLQNKPSSYEPDFRVSPDSVVFSPDLYPLFLIFCFIIPVVYYSIEALKFNFGQQLFTESCLTTMQNVDYQCIYSVYKKVKQSQTSFLCAALYKVILNALVHAAISRRPFWTAF
ncbi:Hypothetical_protein [Hexamita inflata]|uniref:Hypothetical_protein n=1 Tax=Hexamita inflata TaxID=28002 RepID=A0ABP1GH05_9EUKA